VFYEESDEDELELPEFYRKSEEEEAQLRM